MHRCSFTRWLLFSLVAALFVVVAVAQQTGSSSAEAQQKLSKNASHFKQFEGKPYYERTPKPDGTVDLSSGAEVLYVVHPPGQAADPLGDIKKRFAFAKTVVVATATSRNSALTPNQSFLYSDWEFTVVDVLKNETSVGLAPRQVITVTRSGGELELPGRKLIAQDKNFPDFVIGHTYLLGLDYLYDSSSFKAENLTSFDVTGPAIVSLNDPSAPEYDVRDWIKLKTPETFVESVRQAVTQ